MECNEIILNRSFKVNDKIKKKNIIFYYVLHLPMQRSPKVTGNFISTLFIAMFRLREVRWYKFFISSNKSKFSELLSNLSKPCNRSLECLYLLFCVEIKSLRRLILPKFKWDLITLESNEPKFLNPCLIEKLVLIFVMPDSSFCDILQVRTNEARNLYPAEVGT